MSPAPRDQRQKRTSRSAAWADEPLRGRLAGWPAMSVPAGTDPRGRPLAVQLVARTGGEAVLLSVAAQLEQLRPWPRIAPAFGV
jgi:Asp-tRNA(Asn)/Glu-tRNA(Gln) amidotransferase A subunit family amidase